MKVAVAGKGGAGKTTIAGTLARVLARDDRHVLAIDGDCGPNLGLTLGIPAAELADLPTLPRDLFDGSQLTRPLAEVQKSHGVAAADGVQLLVMARPEHAGTGCLTDLQATVRALVAAAPSDDGHACVLDTDATAESFSRGVARHVDTMLLVVEPSAGSLRTAPRLSALARDLGIDRVLLVANKVRDDEDLAAIAGAAAAAGLLIAGVVPFDDTLAAAERSARAPLDVDPAGPAVMAIAEIAGRLYVSLPSSSRVASP